MMKESIFKIDNYRNCFYQWDIGQKLTVLDGSITAVNYAANGEDEAYKIPVVNGKAVVPDELLQGTDNLVVWAMVYDGSQYTKATATFGVIARQKPSDYVYTPTEFETFASKLDKNLGEENSGKYLAIGEDGEIEPVELDLDDYATVAYVEDEVLRLDGDIEGKVSIDQGVAAVGKYLAVNDEGEVEPVELDLSSMRSAFPYFDNNDVPMDWRMLHYPLGTDSGLYLGQYKGEYSPITPFFAVDNWDEVLDTTASYYNANQSITRVIRFCLNLIGQQVENYDTKGALMGGNPFINNTNINTYSDRLYRELYNLKSNNIINPQASGNQFRYLFFAFTNQTGKHTKGSITYDLQNEQMTYTLYDNKGELSFTFHYNGYNRNPAVLEWIYMPFYITPNSVDKLLSVNSSGYPTWITPTYASSADLAAKVDIAQGVAASGNVLAVNAQGNVEPVDNIATEIDAQDYGIEGGYYPWLEWKKFYTTNTTSFKDNVTYNLPIYVAINGFTDVASNWFEYITTTQSVTQQGTNVTKIVERLYNIIQGSTTAYESMIINQIATKNNVKAIAQEIQAIEQEGIMDFHAQQNRIYINNPCKEFGVMIGTKNTGQYGTYNQYQVNFYYTGKTKGTTYVTCNYNFTTDTYTNLSVTGSDKKVPGVSNAGKVLGVDSTGYLEWKEKSDVPFIVTIDSINYTATATCNEIQAAMTKGPVYASWGSILYNVIRCGPDFAMFGYYVDADDYVYIYVNENAGVNILEV